MEGGGMMYSEQDKKNHYDYKADFRCNTMLMLEIFTKSKIDPMIGVKPSVYVRELYMSHEERQNFLNLNNDCIKLFPNRAPKQVIEKWDVKPRIILFSKWTVGEEYETFFTVRNRFRTSKVLKLSLKDSPVFELEKLVNFNRLGSMVTFGYKVRFRPKELIDYHDTIKLEAENGTLEIYVLAISPRPMIDFPDEIDFGNVLFNFDNSKQIRLENISPMVVEANLETQGTFTLDTHKILLNPNETMILKISLNEKKKKKIRDKLLIRYQTGENLYIDLSAKCYSANIYFENKHEIDLGELFVGLYSTETVTLVNESDELLRYTWMSNRNVVIDDLEAHVYSYTLGNNLKKMKFRTGGMKYYKMITDEAHQKITDTILDEELDGKLNFYFIDENFDIQPKEGTINPKSKQVFVITFKPKTVEKLKRKAYLEIEGLKERLKVKLKGFGIGPHIVLNVNTIDFDQIFICSQHTYIISAKNIGLVKGAIRYLNTNLSFGETINCSPPRLELLPGEVNVFELTLSSTVAGSFVEDVWFEIEESLKRIRCVVKGQIINPRLILNKKIINFGQVSLGFKYTSSFSITNESPIPVEYKIEVVGDGNLPAVQVDVDFDSSLPLYPHEFTIDPEKDQILPSHCQAVEVSLVSNIVRDHTTVLKIYLWDVLVEECSLILKYTSITPIITCKPSEILLRYAFIDYDYTRQITLINSHNQPTYYYILPQDETSHISSPGLLYNLEEYSGYLGPNSSKVIQVEIRVLSLQPSSEKLLLRVFGLPNIINLCTIKVYGMGPVVNPSTFTISWGTVPVLKKIDKSLILINVSPICAFYKVMVEKYPFIWDISSIEGSIPPETEYEIIITATLKDSGVIEDHLIVEIIGSREITVSLSAFGYGTSIVTVPNLFPVYDIGKVFRNEKHNDIIKVTNAGTRHHTIMFTTMKEIKNLTKAKADQEQGTYFKLIPYKLDLEGGETQEMHLIYEWDKMETLEDTYYCYAIIERRGKRVALGSSTIRASFTDTELTFVPTSLHFRVDVPKWSTPVLPQYKTLTVSSQWSHPLFLHCEVKKPFAFKSEIVNKPGIDQEEHGILNFTLEPQESQRIEIKFDPLYISNRYSRVCYAELIVTFKDHKVKASVPLRGEVNFPNIILSTHEINFGCVLPNTEAMQYAVLTNNTPLDIEFEWFWAQQRLFDIKPYSISENMISSFEDEGEFSEEKSEISCNEEEFLEEEDEERGNRTEVNEKDLTQNRIIINQPLSQTISSSDYSENATDVTSNDSPKDSDVDDSYQKECSVDREISNQDICYVERKPAPFKNRRKKDGGYFVKSINEFGINNVLRKIPSTAHDTIISQVIDIIPPKGELKPHETHQVTFVFNPHQLMKIVGKALLIVAGGPEEVVTFKGSCYHAVYEIIPPRINFGFGPFCELWCSSLFIHNKGLKFIQVSVNIPEFDTSAEQTGIIYLLPEKNGTSPKITFIPSCEVASYKLAFYPGGVGEIAKEFTIQIDDLPPVAVPIRGYALPNQVHVALPRTIVPYLDEHMYIVLASLTSQWFSSRNSGSEFDTVTETFGPDDTEGWELITENAISRISADDINMAYERLVCELISIKYNGNIPHTTNSFGINYLVGFDMPPYHLDFGSVIANTKAQCMVVYSNYCPIESIIKVNFPDNSEHLLDRYGVVIKPVCSHILHPFESKQFAILLRPPHNSIPCDDIETNVSFSFNFKVSCGPCIPVNVSASITKPYLCTPDSFDFGYVKIGYKRYLKFIVSNVNNVDCEWFAFIRPLKTYRVSDPDFNEKGNPFTVQPVYGYAKPKSKFIITIGFEPTEEALYDVVLQFIINMNPKSVAIRLKGYGLKPHLIADKISFGYCIPYSEPLRERLIVRNPCLFPVKVYVLGSPKDFPREQDLFNILLQYYRKDKICVPSTYYKNKPTHKIYTMFRKLVKRAVRKYLKDILEYLNVILTESPNVWRQANQKLRSWSPKSVSNLNPVSQTRMKKGEKIQPKSTKGKKIKDKIKSEKSKEMLLFINAVLEENFTVKTLKQVINDYIKYMSLLNKAPSNLTLHTSHSGKSQVKEDIRHIECEDLVFVYGSPRSDAGKFTWRIGYLWKISTVSLDWEIISDLMEYDCDETRFIRGTILDYFNKKFEDEEKSKYDYNTLEGFAGIVSLVAFQYFLEYRLQRELSQTKSKTSLPKRKVDFFKEPVTLLNIPWKSIEHIILRRLYLKAKNGLVFESITSSFLLDPISSLIFLLNIFQASRIYVICLVDDADREICLDFQEPDPNVIQAFSNLRYLDFFSLPESVRRKMTEELKKLNRKMRIDEPEDDKSSLSDTKKDLRKKGSRQKIQRKANNPQPVKDKDSDKKSIKKRTPTVDKKSELFDRKKKSARSKTGFSEHKLSGIPLVFTNEYIDNLNKIQAFVEAYQSNEVSAKNLVNQPSVRTFHHPHSASRRNLSSRSSGKLVLDDQIHEIMKKKAKLGAKKEFPFDFWIFCSHHPYKDYQFENYIKLVGSWKDISITPEREKPVLKSQLKKHNYFVIKKKVEKTYPESDWENECKLFKIVTINEKKYSSDPVIAYATVSRGRIPAQSKMDVKSKENERKRSINIEIIENLLKDVEVTYLQEMDNRLKTLNSKFKTGVVIKPGEYKEYDVLFQPTGCSNYEQEIHVRIGGCDEVKKISVFATCDIPDISFDPCFVFSNIIMNDNFLEVLSSGYFIKNKVFHFGTALVGHEDDGRLFQTESILKLKNTSAIDLKLSVSIIEEKIETGKFGEEEFNDKTDIEVVKQFLKRNKFMEGQHRILAILNIMKNEIRSLTDVMNPRNPELSPSVFGFEAPFVNIEAGEEKEFVISACPPQDGLYSCRYLFSIENNPKVYSMKAVCVGTSPKVIFNPVELYFEDVIIYRQFSQSFSMENKCSIPLSWKIVNADIIHPKVSLSRIHGTLNPESFEIVYVTYHPSEVQEIREQLIIQIFDKKVEGKSLLEHKYSVHMKSYDVFIEVFFERSIGNSVNLNNVIVYHKYIQEFGVKNRGRGDVVVKIELNKDSSYLNSQVEVNLKDTFALLTPQMVLQSELSITCLEEVKLEEEPLVLLEIIDPRSMETVAKIPLYISLQAYFSRFTISPTNNLDFGNLMVGELKQLKIVLVNCGLIDFKFRFLPENKCFSEREMFLRGLKPNLEANAGRKLSKKISKTVNQSRKFEYDYTFKKNLNNIIFMNKFMKLKNREYLRNTFKKNRNHFKCFIKIMCKSHRKLKFHLTKSKLRNSNNQLNYYDLAQIKTIKNMWNLLNFEKLKSMKGKPGMVNQRSYEEQWECAFDKSRKLKCYIPPFRIVPALGKLGAGKEVAIKVHCNPMFKSTFLETVNLFVTDALPEVRRGFPIHLSVESSLPKVNFEDYASIFREIEVVEKCNEHLNNDNGGEPYEVFCIQERSLHFVNTIVGTNHSVTAFLHSENQLDAAVLVTLAHLGEGVSPFSVDNKDSCVVYIKPYGYSSFTISFSPQNLEECRATITMTLEVPSISKDKGYISTITFTGKGSYPNIMMKLSNSPDEQCEMIDYGMVLINSSEKKTFCIENTGNVIAQVILEVLNNKDIFLIGLSEQSEENIEICAADTFMNTKVSIPPKKRCQLELEFKPKELRTYSSRINVHIIFNPFETLYITIYGTGYIGDLVIEGLKFTQGEPVTYGMIPAEYFLDFGNCVVGKKYIQEFTLKSHCTNIIRFRFDTFERVVFIPSCGHIYPGSKKTIHSVIQISDCTEIDETIQCHYQEIIYKQNAQSNEWDNTQTSVKWTKVVGDSLTKENLHKAQILKIERHDAEPEYNVIKEEFFLNLSLSAVFDIPKLTVITELVEFPPVIVSQSSVREVLIQNTKNCDVSFMAVIIDAIAVQPESVPEVTDFSFGKFDYNLMELPTETKGNIYDQPSFSLTNMKTSEKKELWAEVKTKHTQTLYGKSVNIIIRKKKSDKEEKDEAKSLKKYNRLKTSKSRSLLDVKKRGVKKTISGTSISERRGSRFGEGKRGTISIQTVKSFIKLGARKSDVYEFNFSDLVKIGKTHIILPSDLPETTKFIAPPEIESSSQCFSINVSSGILKANDVYKCLVTFTPKHINKYRADLRFYNTVTQEFSSLFVQGIGILPLCHIEIYENDYLTANNPMISHLPSNTRAVIIESIFKESYLKKSFKVYNIAEIPYHFKWIHVKNSSPSVIDIKCLTEEGEIQPRDSSEMEFSFFPMDYKVYESLWVLKIKEFFLEQYILLVFKVRKPLVSFERKFIVCEPTVKGSKRLLNVKLINKEEIPFDFAVNEDSLYSGLKNDRGLCISPMVGIIGPQTEKLLVVEFTAQCASDVTFYIKVSIHSDAHHLKYEIPPLRILSKCYYVEPKVSCIKEDGSKHEIFHSDIKLENIIHVGKLLLRIPYSLQFNISNIGESPMYFETFLSDTNHKPGISTKIIEKSGVVNPSHSNSFTVKLTANKKVDFEEALTIKICKGPNFVIKLTGTAAEPVYEFSPKSINFGICLIDEKNVGKYHGVLEFSNLDTESVLLEKLEHPEGFILDFSSLIIEPRAVHKIQIIFNPSACKIYSGKIHFLVNGFYKHEIEVMGEGESFKLALHERESIILDFGLFKAREISSQEIAIINHSRVPVNFSMKLSQDKKDSFPLTIDVLDRNLHLLPEEIRLVKVNIYAEKRIQNFTCNIMYEGYGIEEILFIVKGTVLGYKFELDQKSILFESAAIGCVNTKQVALINSGDIGSRFKLQTRFVSDVFAIKPMEGYCPPSSRTVIDISFMSNFITKYYNNTLLFLIENYEPLSLNLNGIGAKLPPPIEMIKLRTHVRSRTAHYVDLINRTYEEMTVYPVIIGEYFSTEEFIKIPANSHIDCKVYYHPLTQTTTKYHLGHFFCGFPNGELMFYQLVGEAKAALPQELHWECKARKQFVGKIPLNNWSNNTAENFMVEIRSVKLTVPAFYKITSHDIISVPPKDTRNCIINLICYKETAMSFKVFFTNVTSKEYLHYKVNVKFAPPEVQTITLATSVHEPTFHRLCLTNPMDKISLFTFKSPHRDIEPTKKSIQVWPRRKKYLTLRYTPTHSGMSEIMIQINNYLLGPTVYKLEISAIDPSAEKLLEVQAPLGSTKLFSLPVKNPYQKVVTFFFQTDSRDLSTKKSSFFVGPGKKIMLEVKYEPTYLGNNVMTILLSTNGYGNFLYYVKALCTPPEPSGPVILPTDTAFELEFKNVFFSYQEFFLKINNESFKLLPKKLCLKSKETGLISILLQQASDDEENCQTKAIPKRGKLTVTCVPNSIPIEWVYYLQAAE